ncbi:23S rRNA pseudouridine2605 synthase [Rubritalea squalenifaciens DSM 18772]|uniref:Pseudouridine synthase n=2 Tax=Rubritalea TaxID=361050 RepID=A0A1M6HL15_9BACT|nr:pseudouridine synthase [Rubritalea squalenifaciens]SHJ22862.1 23S rRNA pseudouridine2605 synthase [Rubritalea squalenifaciens DSM 18772]
MSDQQEGIRLNKYLASCGIGSRRACDELIKKGQVIVNGKVSTDLSMHVTEDDFVKLDNKRVLPRETMTILFNKPKGCVCTKDDELDRETIYKHLPPTLQHLNHVGRLDRDSEGLLVLTNDGELANILTHPKKKVEKEYLVTVNQAFSNEVLDQFLHGIWTGEHKAFAKYIKRLSPRRFLITIDTGHKRQIRMMCKAAQLNVTKLVRVRIGSLMANGLEQGRYRTLDMNEIQLMQINPKPSGKVHKATAKRKLAKKKTAKPAHKKIRSTKRNKSYKRR